MSFCFRQGRRALVPATVIVLLSAAIWGCGGQTEESSRGRSAEKDEAVVTGEDVKREFDKAFDTTKDFLKQKGSSLQVEFEKGLQAFEKKVDLLQEQAGQMKEEGSVRAEETMKVLRQKQEVARKKFEEFKDSSAEVRDEARVRMEKAYQELEEAYRKARERFDSQKD